MRHTLFGTAGLVLLAAACAREAPPSETPARAPIARSTPRSAEPAEHESSPAKELVTRRVGDFSVHMISGSFRKQPALLTERVMGEEGNAWVLEYTLEDTQGATRLRAFVDRDTDRVVRVIRFVDGEEKPGTVADYDALMAAASVVPDTNEGMVANSSGTCSVGPNELDCETKTYRVFLGERAATLGVTQSNAVPGVDLAGEITAADGSVIFRSELIERGNEGETANDSFALR